MSEEHLLVLLVDDETSLRKPLAKYLSNMYGYHVDTAANEEEAWEHVLRADRPYDVALIDDLLTPKPGTDPEPIGIELMAWIQERYPDTECIIFTGWGMDRALEALQAGAYRYLAKPLNLDELGMTVRMAAEQGRLRRERDLLSATLEISRAMLSELDVGKTLKVIAEAVPKLVEAEGCAVAQEDQATGQVRYEPMILMGDATVRWHRHLKGVSLTRQIIETGQEFFLPDVDARAEEVDENLRRAEVKSFIGLPIPGEPQNLGVLYAYSTKQEAFRPHEQQVLQLLAGQASIAIANAQTFAKLEEYALHMEALVGVSEGLIGSLNLAEQLDMVRRFVREELRRDTFFIALYDKVTDKLSFPIAYDRGQPIEIPERTLGDDPDKWGLTGYVVKEEQELYWTDEKEGKETQERLGLTPSPIGDACVSCFFVPLRAGEEMLGALSLQSYKPHAFDPIVKNVFRALAGQVAVSIQNAQLYEEAKGHADKLAALYETGKDLTSTLELNVLLQLIAERSARLTGADKSLILLVDTEAEKLTKAVGFGFAPGQIEGFTYQEVQDGISGWVLREGKPTISEDILTDPRNTGLALEMAMKEHERGKSIAVAPLFIKGEVIGTLTVINNVRKPVFSQDDLDLVVMLANQAAIAIENAQLYEREWRRAREAEAMVQVGQAISSTLDLDRILETVAKNALPLLGLEDGKSTIFLVDEKTGDFVRATRVPPHKGGNGPRRRGGLSSLVIETGEPIVIPDVRRDSRVRASVIEEGVRSLIGVPLKVKERTIGVLFANTLCPCDFTQRDIEMLSSLANQAAVAIENARLFSQLSETKEQLDVLIESSFDAVIAIDQEKGITIFNRRAEEMFGWEAEEMLGQTVARLHMDVETAKRIFDVVNQGEPVAGWNVHLKHRDGTRIPALLSATLIRDSQGRPIGQGGFMRVKLAEDRLRAFIGVSQAITGVLELDEVLDLIVKSAVAVFPAAQGGAIHLYDKRAGTLRIPAITRDYSAEALKALNLRVGEGIAGWVFQNQQPLVVDDTRQDPRYKRIDHPEVRVHRSMICVPLRVREQVIGTLSLNNSDITGAFQPEDLGLLASFADQAAIAIDNARRMQELEQMRQAAEAMSRAFEPRQALQQIVESASQVLRADSAAIWSYDEVRDKFILDELVAVGISLDELERFREEEPKPGRTADMVMREGYVAVTDISQPEYNFLGQSTQELLSRIGVRSFQGIALRVGDERLGVLYANYNHLRTFGEDKGATLRTFASHASLALKNARLLTQMQRTREAAGVIAGVTVQEDLNHTLKIIAQHTQRVLHSDVVTLYSYDEATKQFGEWATKILDPRDLAAARAPDKLTTKSVIWSILNLTESPHYCLAEDHAGRHELLGGHFVDAEGIRSAIGIQLRVGERKVGVMFVNFRSPHRFTSDEIATIRLFADQAAMAIRNAQLYGAMRTLYGGLLRAGEAAVEAGKFYPTALRVIADAVKETLGCDVVSLYAYYGKENEITYPSVIAGDLLKPGKQADWEAARLGKRLRLDTVSREMVVRQLFESGRSLYASDVCKDPVLRTSDFVRREAIKSSAAILLKAGDKTVGILFVNYRSPHVFAEEEREMLELFATQAAIAIQNAQQYEELKHTKGLVGARTALAWMGMASSAWRHASQGKAITIKEEVESVRSALPKEVLMGDIDRRLAKINRLANQISDEPITAPLSIEETAESVSINELLRERFKQLWGNRPYSSVQLKLNLGLRDAATVRASPEWLRRVFDILVDNAVEAVSKSPVKQITVATRQTDGQVEITISDTGIGIPDAVLPELFQEPIKKPRGAKGQGVGLLMAQTIVQAYRGEIQVGYTDAAGTTMVIRFPLET